MAPFRLAGVEIEFAARSCRFKDQRLRAFQFVGILAVQKQRGPAAVHHVAIAQGGGNLGRSKNGDGDFVHMDAGFGLCHGVSLLFPLVVSVFRQSVAGEAADENAPGLRYIEGVESAQHGDVQQMMAAFGDLRPDAVFLVPQNEKGGRMQPSGEGVDTSLSGGPRRK